MLSEITVKETAFLSANGKDTVCGCVYIPAGEPRCVLQISHGMNEHMGRYRDFIRFMVQNEVICCIYDHIGHGKTAGDDGLGFFAEKNGYQDLTEDTYSFFKLIHREFPLPHILLGHSMGSFIVRLYAAKYGEGLSGLIVSGTGGKNPLAGFGILLSDMTAKIKGPRYYLPLLEKMAFGTYNDRISPLRTQKDWLTHDGEIVDRYIADKYCMFPFSASAYRDLITLNKKSNQKTCFEKTPKNLPVLLLSGGMDPVGDYGKGPTEVAGRYESAGLKDVTLKIYPEGRHEMLNELNRAEVYQYLAGWMTDRLQKEKETAAK